MTSHPERLGKYRLGRRLAVGGTAEVFLAVGEGLSGFRKEVVVKRLIPEHARDPHLLAMFLDEARLMALFHHPHLVEVYDIGQEADAYYFAMEHLPGRDLRDLLAASSEPLPLGTAAGIVVAVARGLDWAHETRDQAGKLLGVVHRDVSPSNVLLGWDGRVKLVDFGIAKWAAQRSRTEQGTLKGKFAYMSPEQCRGEPLDRRSDVFALGVLLTELLTSRRPFARDTDYEILSAIVRGEVAPPSAVRPGLPAGLDEVALRALALDPAARFPSASAVAAALAPFSDPPEALAAGVAAVLAARFPREAPSPGPVLHDAPSGAVAVAPLLARAAVGGERTATDAAMAAPGVAALPARPRKRFGRPAIGLFAGGLLLLGLGLAWGLWPAFSSGSGPPAGRSAAARAPSAPTAASTLRPPSARESPPTTESALPAASARPDFQDRRRENGPVRTAAVADPAMATDPGRAETAPRPADARSSGVRGARRARQAARGAEPVRSTELAPDPPVERAVPTSDAPKPAVRLWDPDSPVPPPP